LMGLTNDRYRMTSSIISRSCRIGCLPRIYQFFLTLRFLRVRFSVEESAWT
jgi:hypothetical protein